MKKSLIPKLICLFFIAVITNPVFIFAQDTSLYMPRNIKQAYENGTRSFDGKPGPKYWQNYADYKINVEIDTSLRSIIGNETISYKNNSPDTLKELVFRLYQNLYRKGEARDFPVDTSDLTGGVKINQLSVGGNQINADTTGTKFHISGTNMIVKLDNPLPPKDSIGIECKWSFIMPLKTDIRMGMIDSTSYYVGYWYPQVSVYDDIDGWDMIQYTGRQEFYNNFGNFDIEITVPKNYVVWATGILQNPDVVFTQKFLERRKKAETSDSVIHIITENDLKNGGITNDNPSNTWHFKAENVTDFAFAASDHDLWDAGSVVVDDQTGRRTIVAAAYRKEALDFPLVAKMGMKSIEYYSKKIPGVPFPYPKMTVVNGAHSGGMEYPMIVNDYSAPTLSRTLGVTAHEIAHTYFPFYMGINETKYAWMDEGWATAFTTFVTFDTVRDYDSYSWLTEIFDRSAGNELEMPMMIPSTLLKDGSYSIASYFRPAEAYLILRDMLGDKLFLKALHEYINRWHGKHPIPYDFFYSFNDALNENLDWFWKPWFFEFGDPDLAIKSVKTEGDKIKIDIQKIGNIPVPVKIIASFSDGTKDSLYQTAAVWKGTNEYSFEIKTDKKLNKVVLGDNSIPDVNLKNNIYPVKDE
ncbi:MAG: M1 family metallopeptidase [Ignavibacteriaceae bacterium]